MVNPILDAKNECRALVASALAAAMADGSLPEAEAPEFNVEIPGDTSHGDLSTNAAMVSARAFRKAPRVIADAITSHIDLDGSSFEKVEVAGPGFINFFLGRKWFSDGVLSVLREGEDYGRTGFGEGKKVLVEFVSANPTGPMHIGNARGGAIGDTLASVLDWAGYNVSREFYVNDAGNQIQKFGLSLSLRYLQVCKGEEGSPPTAICRRTATTARTSSTTPKTSTPSTGTPMKPSRKRSGGRRWSATRCRSISRGWSATCSATGSNTTTGSENPPSTKTARPRRLSTS